ncbi:hypothetical protein R1flu_004413 [Riccia fluitans]|uniref:Uncharacterized protein n=1 Tax=Riccia fluitans TaxID=41844 RepID=A0ABD1YT57_9MARC
MDLIYRIGTSWRTVVGKYRHAWIKCDLDFSHFQAEVVPRIEEVARTFLSGSRSASGRSKARNLPLSADGKAILSFSLLNAEPEDWIFDWDFEDLKNQFFQAVMDALERVARLSLESQILYYTPKAVKSQWDASHDAYVVPVKQLRFPSTRMNGRFINCRNWTLSPTDGFTSPGRGVVVVYNPKNLSILDGDVQSSAYHITAKDFESVAGIIVSQLRTLFGLPPVLQNDQERGFFSSSPARTGFTEL